MAAVLLNMAVGDNLHCVFVDNGLLRKNEFQDVLLQYKNMGLNIIGVNAQEKFYNSLSGISDPERENVLEQLLLMYLMKKQKISICQMVSSRNNLP